VCFGLGASGAAQPVQTLNMSLDLVRLGIASHNLTPNDPTLDARPLIQAAFGYVRANHVPRLTATRGAYYLLTPQNAAFHLFVEDLTDLTIDLAGSDLYFKNGRLGGFQCYYCTRLTLTNFTMDYLEPPSTHARVTSVDPIKRIIHYGALPGYRSPTVFADRAVAGELSPVVALVFRDGQIVPGTTRMPLQAVTATSVELFQNTAPWTQGPTLATLRPGDTLVVTFREGFGQLVCWTCEATTYSHIRVYSAGNWAVHFAQSTGSVVEHLRLEPRPGALIGTTSDGIHFTHPIGANHIRRNYVTRTVDDALVIDSNSIAIVQSQPTTRQIVIGTRSNGLMNARFPNGTAMAFLDYATGGTLASGVMTTQQPPDTRQNAYASQATLTFDRDLPALAPGTYVSFHDAAMLGAGSTIEDNIVEDVPFGRGVWIGGSSEVAVQRNVIRTTSSSGIIVMQHVEPGAGPAPASHGVTIRSNVVEGPIGPAASGTGSQSSTAAIMAITSGPGFRLSSTPVSTNLTVRDNYVADSGRGGIFVGQTANSSIINNFITRWYQRPHLPIFGVHPDDQEETYGYWREPIAERSNSGLTVAANDIRPQSSIVAPVSFSTPVMVAPPIAAALSVTVTPVVAGFQWKASTEEPWITITSSQPVTGPGTLGFAVADNSTATARAGSITVAGQRLAITQPPMTITPAPGLLALAPPIVNGTTVTLNWSTPLGGNGAAGFTIVASLSPGGPPLVSLPVGAVQTLSVTASSGVYYVRIAGFNASGTGPFSNEVRVVVGAGQIPGPPENLAAHVTGSRFTLAWRAPDNVAVAPVQTYVIEAGSASGLSNLASFATGSDATQFDAPAVGNGSYFIRLRARNGAGTGPATPELRVVIGPPPPGAPVLTGGVGAGRSVVLTWTQPTTGVAPTGYRLEAGTTPGSGNAAVINLPAGQRSFSAPGVPPGTYYVRVVPESSQGPGMPSNELHLIVP
jgi:hypothetical protein